MCVQECKLNSLEKAETVSRASTLQQQQQQRNECGHVDKLSLGGRVADNKHREANGLSEGERESLEVTSSGIIHEVSRVDWFDFYHKQHETTLLSGLSVKTSEKTSKQRIKHVKQLAIITRYVCCWWIQNLHCVLGRVAASNKGMSHDFTITASLFLKGNGNNKALGTVPISLLPFLSRR